MCISINTKMKLIPSRHSIHIFCICILLLIIIAPAILGYVANWVFPETSILVLSIYAIYCVINFIIQIITSNINRRRITKDVEQRHVDWNEIRVGVIVVGYKEDPFMFQKCLESIRDSGYTNIARRICIIDGTDDDDMYMADIYSELFQSDIIKLDYLMGDKRHEEIDFSVFGDNNKDICIMQPHKGKRDALYTGFKILLNDESVNAIITTDSDTILDENAVKEMAYQLHNEDVGAVAGQITVWNTDTILTFVVSMRYWFSFNLERACDSFFKCVMCVAGPMACYRVSVLKEVIERWLNQKFLGVECTYGDDRHLTNQVLSTGKKVIYTQYAVGHTDTPAGYVKYLNQQTRWGKSYFREIFFTIGCLDKQSLWIGFELFYHAIYFFLLMFWTMYLLWFTNNYTKAFAIIIMTGFGIIKSIYGYVLTKDFRYLFFFLYSYVYYFVIIPSKITALLTLRDGGWGTRGKLVGNIKSYMSTIVAFLWFAVLCAGFGYSVHDDITFDWSSYRYRFSFLSILIYSTFMVITMIVYSLLQRMGKLDTNVYKILKQNKNNNDNAVATSSVV